MQWSEQVQHWQVSGCHQTSFLAMKKSLSRFICQKPTDRRIEVCTTAHHKTLLLVSSLIWRNVSSFSWIIRGDKKGLKSITRYISCYHIIPVLLLSYCHVMKLSHFQPRQQKYFLFTLWYSCCLVICVIWSMRWLRLLSRLSMLCLVLSTLGSIECSPIWTSKCSFCVVKWG